MNWFWFIICFKFYFVRIAISLDYLSMIHLRLFTTINNTVEQFHRHYNFPEQRLHFHHICQINKALGCKTHFSLPITYELLNVILLWFKQLKFNCVFESYGQDRLSSWDDKFATLTSKHVIGAISFYVLRNRYGWKASLPFFGSSFS